jgi:hypothetical protein
MADRRKVKLIVAIAVVIVVGTIIAVGVLASGGKRAELVKLELRAKPVATIRFKGKQLGHTPIVVQVPRSKEPLSIEATFTVHKLNATNGAPNDEIWKETKAVIPDAPQSVDFDIKAAAKQPDPGR